MTFVWKKLSVASVTVDGQTYSPESGSVRVNSEKGMHRVEVLVSGTPVSELRGKLLLSWIATLFGTIGYTLEEAYSDAEDELISFSLPVEDCDALLLLDDYIPSLDDLKRTKVTNARKYNLVTALYVIPLVLLGGALFAAFLTIGINAMQNGKIGAGILAVAVASLGLFIPIGCLVKVIKERPKKTKM